MAKLLVSGAGIAGMGLAHWLGRGGHDVTLIDRMPSFRALGHFMTLKGTGVAVVKSMGLYDELVAHRIPSQSITFFDQRGRPLRTSSVGRLDESLGGFILLRRAHLHDVLRASVHPSVALRFATEIVDVVDRGDAVDVAFTDGKSDSYDALIGADGVHSSLRQRAFPELATRSLGGHYVVFVVDHDHGLGERVHSTFGEGVNISLIPLGEQKVGAQVYLDDACPTPPPTTDPLAWRAYFASLFADMPRFVVDAVAALRADDELFTDRIVMVPAHHLVKGRIALLGDAGYCPTFFSGMGASAALQGGYALAHLLAQHDVARALARYEARVVPIARAYQTSAFRGRAATLCRGVRGRVRNLATRYAPDALVDRTTRAFYQAELDLAALAAA